MQSTQEKTPDVEILEDTLNNFLMLKELWQEERQKLVKQNADFKSEVTRLAAQVEKLKEADVELRKQVSHSIMSSSLAMAEKVGQEFKKTAMKDVESAAHSLKVASIENAKRLSDASDKNTETSIIFGIGLFLLPIIASLLIFWWLSPTPMMALSDKQMATYQDGQLLDGFWSKLNKKQQKFLTDVANGKRDNHGKHIEEMQDNTTDSNNDNGYS